VVEASGFLVRPGASHRHRDDDDQTRTAYGPFRQFAFGNVSSTWLELQKKLG
jgi:hypothetical protein